MTRGYDAVIVGAGIVGAACADEFARRDMRVAIVDRDVVEAVRRLPAWGTSL
jgi:D-hydroxyproline dehydrogenase subunit beta